MPKYGTVTTEQISAQLIDRCYNIQYNIPYNKGENLKDITVVANYEVLSTNVETGKILGKVSTYSVRKNWTDIQADADTSVFKTKLLNIVDRWSAETSGSRI